MVAFQTKHEKVSKSSGKNAPMKKDGYATGPVPPSMIGNKGGRHDFAAYSGPDVAKVSK
jgi:hypothetical protein